MKTICMVAIASYPNDPRVRRETEALVKKGYKIDVICRSWGIQPKVEKFDNVTAYRLMNFPPQEKILKYVLFSFLFFILAFIKLQQLSFKNKYDLIQFHNMPDHVVFVGIIQKLMGIPLVLDIHDLTVELTEEKWPGSKFYFFRQFVRLVEKNSCKFTDHIITVTDGCKERLMQRGVPPEKITIILNSTNQEIFKFIPKESNNKILKGAKIIYHGTIAKRFGLHIIIEAMRKVVDQIPESVFVLYGRYDESYRNILELKIKELNLKENVIFKDRVFFEEFPKIFESFDIGVVPYLNNDYMNLALPTKACEYAASGVPMVASYLDTLSKAFNEDCISYVNTEDPEEFATEIIRLCYDPEFRNHKIHQAYAALQKISWAVMGNNYYHLINELISKRDER